MAPAHVLAAMIGMTLGMAGALSPSLAAPRSAVRRACTPTRARVSLAAEQDLYTREPLHLSWDNAQTVIDEAQIDLSTVFGSSAENLAIGITGALELIDVDGPNVIVRLSGTFWHSGDRLEPRVENYIRKRIPEVVDVEFLPMIETPKDDKRPTFA
jgi:predicted NBD/HSP70 family sugar kinase